MCECDTSDEQGSSMETNDIREMLRTMAAFISNSTRLMENAATPGVVPEIHAPIQFYCTVFPPTTNAEPAEEQEEEETDGCSCGADANLTRAERSDQIAKVADRLQKKMEEVKRLERRERRLRRQEEESSDQSATLYKEIMKDTSPRVVVCEAAQRRASPGSSRASSPSGLTIPRVRGSSPLMTPPSGSGRRSSSEPPSPFSPLAGSTPIRHMTSSLEEPSCCCSVEEPAQLDFTSPNESPSFLEDPYAGAGSGQYDATPQDSPYVPCPTASPMSPQYDATPPDSHYIPCPAPSASTRSPPSPAASPRPAQQYVPTPVAVAGPSAPRQPRRLGLSTPPPGAEAFFRNMKQNSMGESLLIAPSPRKKGPALLPEYKATYDSTIESITVPDSIWLETSEEYSSSSNKSPVCVSPGRISPAARSPVSRPPSVRPQSARPPSGRPPSAARPPSMAAQRPPVTDVMPVPTHYDFTPPPEGAEAAFRAMTGRNTMGESMLIEPSPRRRGPPLIPRDEPVEYDSTIESISGYDSLWLDSDAYSGIDGGSPSVCVSPGSRALSGGSPGSRSPGSRSPGSRSSGSRSPGSRSPGSRSPGSRSPGSSSPGSRSPGSSPGSRSPGSRSPVSVSPGRSPGGSSPGGSSPEYQEPSWSKAICSGGGVNQSGSFPSPGGGAPWEEASPGSRSPGGRSPGSGSPSGRSSGGQEPSWSKAICSGGGGNLTGSFGAPGGDPFADGAQDPFGSPPSPGGRRSSWGTARMPQSDQAEADRLFGTRHSLGGTASFGTPYSGAASRFASLGYDNTMDSDIWNRESPPFRTPRRLLDDSEEHGVYRLDDSEEHRVCSPRSLGSPSSLGSPRSPGSPQWLRPQSLRPSTPQPKTPRRLNCSCPM